MPTLLEGPGAGGGLRRGIGKKCLTRSLWRFSSPLPVPSLAHIFLTYLVENLCDGYVKNFS